MHESSIAHHRIPLPGRMSTLLRGSRSEQPCSRCDRLMAGLASIEHFQGEWQGREYGLPARIVRPDERTNQPPGESRDPSSRLCAATCAAAGHSQERVEIALGEFVALGPRVGDGAMGVLGAEGEVGVDIIDPPGTADVARAYKQRNPRGDESRSTSSVLSSNHPSRSTRYSVGKR